jgi:ABC-2 type transport system permease protein
MVIPGDFAACLEKGTPVSVGFILDGANSNRATILSGYIEFITSDYSSKIAKQVLSRAGREMRPLINIEPRVWFNPELKSVNYMVPGVMGMLTMILLMNITSLCIVREREVGTAEQLVVTPIKPIELIIGKTIPAAFAGFLVTTLVLVFGLVWFNIDFAGSVWLLYLFAAFFMFLCDIDGIDDFDIFTNRRSGYLGKYVLYGAEHAALRLYFSDKQYA